MSTEDIRKDARRIVKEAAREFAFPLANEFVDRFLENVLEELGCDWRDLDGDPELVDRFLDKVRSLATGLAFGEKYRVPDAAGRQPGPTEPQRPRRKRVSEKQFNRRFRIVRFVVDWLTRNGRERVNWKVVVSLWNEHNPYDQYDGPESLERLFRKARSETAIVGQLLALKVLEGPPEERAQLFSEAVKYIDAEDKDVELATRVMARFGFEYRREEK